MACNVGMTLGLHCNHADFNTNCSINSPLFLNKNMLLYHQKSRFKSNLILLSSFSVCLFTVNSIFTIQKIKDLSLAGTAQTRAGSTTNGNRNDIITTNTETKDTNNDSKTSNLVQIFLLSSLLLPAILVRNTLVQVRKISTLPPNKLQIESMVSKQIVDKKMVKLDENLVLKVGSKDYKLQEFDTKPLLKYLNK